MLILLLTCFLNVYNDDICFVSFLICLCVFLNVCNVFMCKMCLYVFSFVYNVCVCGVLIFIYVVMFSPFLCLCVSLFSLCFIWLFLLLSSMFIMCVCFLVLMMCVCCFHYVHDVFMTISPCL